MRLNVHILKPLKTTHFYFEWVGCAGYDYSRCSVLIHSKHEPSMKMATPFSFQLNVSCLCLSFISMWKMRKRASSCFLCYSVRCDWIDNKMTTINEMKNKMPVKMTIGSRTPIIIQSQRCLSHFTTHIDCVECRCIKLPPFTSYLIELLFGIENF